MIVTTLHGCCHTALSTSYFSASKVEVLEENDTSEDEVSCPTLFCNVVKHKRVREIMSDK